MWWSMLTVFAQPFMDVEKTSIVVGDKKIEVEVADEPHERQLGLMHRMKLDPNSGMIFVYEDAKQRSFWMKNTHIPLSIAYIDANCTVVHMSDMTPLSTVGVPSNLPAQFALEMNQGWFEVNGISIGDSISGIAHCGARRTSPK